MTCEHKWEVADTYVTAFTGKQIVRLVCQKCMSYKEEALKFLKKEKVE